MPFDWKEEFEFFPGIGQMDFFRVTADSLLGLLLSLSFHSRLTGLKPTGWLDNSFTLEVNTSGALLGGDKTIASREI